jgi:hypothetical protein
MSFWRPFVSKQGAGVGPYFEWTYKVKGKTVNVKLSLQAALLYQAATKQHRKTQDRFGQDGAPVSNRLRSTGQAGGKSQLIWNRDRCPRQTVDLLPSPSLPFLRCLSIA